MLVCDSAYSIAVGELEILEHMKNLKHGKVKAEEKSKAKEVVRQVCLPFYVFVILNNKGKDKSYIRFIHALGSSC